MFGHTISKDIRSATMGRKVYEYESLIYEAAHKGGAYVVFPYDVRAEFGKGRVKVQDRKSVV